MDLSVNFRLQWFKLTLKSEVEVYTCHLKIFSFLGCESVRSSQNPNEEGSSVDFRLHCLGITLTA